MAKSKSVIVVIFAQEKITIKLLVKQANMRALKVPSPAWIAYRANTNRTRNKLLALSVKLVKLLSIPLEKSIVTFAPKVDINLNKGQRPALIVYLEHTKIKLEKIDASIAQWVNFQRTLVPRNVTCPPKDSWRGLRKQAKWRSLLVGVRIAQVLETIKYAAVPSYAQLARMKKIDFAWIVPRVIIPQVVLPPVNCARKGNLHQTLLLQVVKNAIHPKGLLL
jgi:hypothetical protein